MGGWNGSNWALVLGCPVLVILGAVGITVDMRGRRGPAPSSGAVSPLPIQLSHGTPSASRVFQTIPTARPKQIAEATPGALQGLGAILSRLEALSGASPLAFSREVLFHRTELRLLLSEGAAAVHDARDRLAEGTLSPAVASALIAALGEAGTSACQGVLREFLSQGCNLRKGALAALARTAEPDSETVKSIRELASASPPDALRDEAVEGLGRFAYAIRRDAGRTGEIAQFLATLDASRMSEQELPRYLAALGFAGLRETLEVLRNCVGHSSSAIREQAVYSLRRIEGADVDALLTDILKRDPSEFVRHCAVRAFWDRDPQAASAAMRMATEDSSSDIRKFAVIWLVERGASIPGTSDLLMTLARTDPSAEVRRYAMTYCPMEEP